MKTVQAGISEALTEMSAYGLILNELNEDTGGAWERVPTRKHPTRKDGYYVSSLISLSSGEQLLIVNYGDFAIDGGAGPCFKWTTEGGAAIKSKQAQQAIQKHREEYARRLEQMKHDKAEKTARRVELILSGCNRVTSYNSPQAKYLESRLLYGPAWNWWEHPTLYHYKHERQYPALIAEVYDEDGQLVTIHRTYLNEDGTKIQSDAKMLMSNVTTSPGAARFCPLSPPQNEGLSILGISEGLETAASVYRLSRGAFPCWAALNAGNMIKFTPPQGVETLIYFADNDEAGRDAANSAKERMSQEYPHLKVGIQYPPERIATGWPFLKDFNDYLIAAAEGWGVQIV